MLFYDIMLFGGWSPFDRNLLGTLQR